MSISRLPKDTTSEKAGELANSPRRHLPIEPLPPTTTAFRLLEAAAIELTDPGASEHDHVAAAMHVQMMTTATMMKKRWRVTRYYGPLWRD
jgi:hypothetical protein